MSKTPPSINNQNICKNCGFSVTGKYCSNCSQSVNTEKISIYSILADVREGMFGLRSKLIYTSRQLIVRPGHAIREYIEGKRVNYMRPVAFMLATAGLYTLLVHLFDLNVRLNDPKELRKVSVEGLGNFEHWINEHFTWLALLSLPIITIVTWILFRKQKHNFTEHLTINSFLLGQRFILRILIIPVLFLTGILHANKYYTIFFLVIEFILIAWSFIQLYNDEPKLKTSFRIFIAYVNYLLLSTLELILLIYLFSL